MDSQDVLVLFSFVVPLVVAITLHEAGHAYAANRLGDPTASLQGRLSLNPAHHVDRFGTIGLPAFLLLIQSPVLFGWARPVPVDYRNLRHPRRDMMLVALAGPGMNLAVALASAFALHIDAIVAPAQAPWMFMNIANSVQVNVFLAVFNMLPFLPLDGGRVLNALLPRRIAALHARTERYGMVFIMLLIFVLPHLLHEAGIADVPLGYYLISLPSDVLREIILHLAGIGIDGSNG